MGRRRKEEEEIEEEVEEQPEERPKRKYTRRTFDEYGDKGANGCSLYGGDFEDDFEEEEIETDGVKQKRFKRKKTFEEMFKQYMIVISKIGKYLRLGLKIPRACGAYNQENMDKPEEHVSKDTVYNWYAKDKVFKALVDDCLDHQTILARVSLGQLINQGDLRAVLYELDRRDEDFKTANALSLAIQSLDINPKTQTDIDDMLKKTGILSDNK